MASAEKKSSQRAYCKLSAFVVGVVPLRGHRRKVDVTAVSRKTSVFL